MQKILSSKFNKICETINGFLYFNELTQEIPSINNPVDF